MRAQIGNGGLDDTDRIDSRMVVEKAVFVGEQSFDQIWLQLVDLDLDAFGGRAGQQPADHLRLEHRVGLGHAERVGNDRDTPAVQADAHHFGGILLRAGLKRSQVNRDRIRRAGVLPRSISRRHLRVAQLRQPVQQPGSFEVVAGADRKRRGEDRGAERGATILDQRGNLAVQLCEVESEREEDEQECAGGEIAHAPSADSPLAAFPFARIRFRRRPPSAAHRVTASATRLAASRPSRLIHRGASRSATLFWRARNGASRRA